MGTYLSRAKKISGRINELANISEDETCISRMFGTISFVKGQNLVMQWMKEAGLKTSIDNIGNVRGKFLSSHKAAKTFVIASHIDTVINAGKFDGPLGVIMGLDVIENLIQQKTEIPFNIELIAFSDEEGVRFHTTYLGSKIVAGSFDNDLLNKKDQTGVTLGEVIKAIGGNEKELCNDAIKKEDWLGYFEIHIEQGPVLCEKKIPVAIVSGIAGQIRIELTFTGIAGHAGTVPMNMRNDALCACAEFILEVERNTGNKEAVATVGKLEIRHSASNVIPGKVACSLDVRSGNEIVLFDLYQNLKNICEEICIKRNIILEWNLIQETSPVVCDKWINKLLAKAISNAGYEVMELLSGAGHDAVPVSAVAPVSMLFVRCYKGISHNPLEDVEINDIAAAIEVSDNFINELINQKNLV